MHSNKIVLAAMCLASIIYAKRDYLPPLHLENIVSEPVQRFLEKIEILRHANSGSDNVILGYSFWEDN